MVLDKNMHRALRSASVKGGKRRKKRGKGVERSTISCFKRETR